MRKALGTVAVLASLLFVVQPAHAITYGEPDGNGHPNVGALIAEWRDPGVKEQLCSGTLIDEDVFLTAAHCTAFLASEGIDDVWVSFDRDVDPVTSRTRLVAGTYVTNPRFTFRQDDPGDLAVVLLSRDQGTAPARLPEVGLFDRMAAQNGLKGQTFTGVGYGVHEPENQAGGPVFPYDGERWRSVSSFQSLQESWLTLSQQGSTQDGGTCYGDSGGPNFLGSGQTETNIIAGITVTGDAMCLATNKTARLDTAAAHAFVDPFLD